MRLWTRGGRFGSDLVRDDIKALLARQAAWQRDQANRPWAEKLRQAMVMRESLRAWCAPPAASAPQKQAEQKTG